MKKKLIETLDPATAALNAVEAMFTPDPKDLKAVVYDHRFGAQPPVHTPRPLSDGKHAAQVKHDIADLVGNTTMSEKWQRITEFRQGELLRCWPLDAVLRGPNPNY
jgi:hypothetical protein